MLRTLSILNGTSGYEDEVIQEIIKLAKPHCDKIIKDSMGNVYAFKKGTESKKTVALFAHTDEVALVISDITPEGLLRFRDIGIDSSVLVGKRVVIGRNKVPGVIGARAVHLMDAKQRKEKLPINRLYIDIGALSRAEAETVVKKGDAAYFGYIWHETKTMLFGKAFDDRAGCAILLELMKNEYKHDLWFVFTTREEVGCRGAMVASRRVDADVYLVVENTTCLDMPDVERQNRSTTLGDGTAISIADRASIADVGLRNALSATGIKHQFKNIAAGGNDARTIGANGKKVASVSCPCRYLHAQVGVISKEDYLHTLLLLDAYLRGENLC